MNSGKVMLVFLGLIFIIIVALSSNRIAGFLRSRFGGIIPTKNAKFTPTPTPEGQTGFFENTPTPTYTVYNNGQNSSGNTNTKGGVAVSSSTEIPATGPSEIVYLLISGSLTLGVTARYFSKKI